MKLVALAAVTTAAVVACTATTDRRPEDIDASPTLEWIQCPDGSAAAEVGGFDCASLDVPLDYDRPGGEVITLSVVRHAATDQKRRIGTLFVNPGGPGGLGTVQIPAWIQFFPDEILAQFDIVSWDPRGIGDSEGVQCFPDEDAETEFLGDIPAFPVTRAEQQDYIRAYRAFGQACESALQDTPLLAHMSTADVARDMDVLRRAVGESQLRYWGLSYGTFLGATYANMFPDRVGAMVLDVSLAPTNWTADGVLDPKQSISLRIGSDIAVARVLGDFLTLCGQVSKKDCAFSGGSPDQTRQKWRQLLGRLKEGPLQFTNGDHQVVETYDRLLSSLSDGLDIVQPYENKVPTLSIQGWSGVAQPVQRMWEARNTPPPVSTPAATPVNHPSSEAHAGPEQAMGVTCGDAPNPRSVLYYPRVAPWIVEPGSEISLASLWGDEPCTTWPIRSHGTYRGPWNRLTANPILVVGNTHDPSTPYQNSLDMVDQLANASLLTVDGYGHTELLNGSTCAGEYISNYLVSGTLPPAGTVCIQDRTPFARAN